MTKVKAKTDELETPAILSQKTLKLKMIAKLEKLIHVRKVATTIDNAIVMDKYGLSKEHSFEMAEVLVVITATKPMDMPVNHSQLMDIVTRLDIYVKPLSFPWRPGDLSCWCLLCNDECVCAPVDVRAHAVPGVQRDVHCRLQEVLYGCGVASSQVKSVCVVARYHQPGPERGGGGQHAGGPDCLG